MTGTPVGTVRSRLHRARHSLVEALVANDDVPHRDQTRLEKSGLDEWKAFSATTARLDIAYHVS